MTRVENPYTMIYLHTFFRIKIHTSFNLNFLHSYLVANVLMLLLGLLRYTNTNSEHIWANINHVVYQTQKASN